MVLGNFDTRIRKIAQATQTTKVISNMERRGVILCSCSSWMSFISIFWTLFKYVSIQDSFDLDFKLQKGDLLFKSLNDY